MDQVGDAAGSSPAFGSTRSSRHLALRGVVTDRQLARALLALAGARTIDLAQLVVVSSYLFTRGGYTLVAAYGVVRTLAPVLGVPLITALCRRRAPGALLLTMAIAAGAASLTMAVIIEAAGPTVGILVSAAVVGVAVGTFRPVVRAALPALARSPGDLVAANAAAGFVDSAATLAGPLLGILVAAAVGVPSLLAVTTTIVVASGLAASRVTPRPIVERQHGAPVPTRASERAAGLHELSRNREARLVAVLGTTQTAVRGAMIVVVVVFAADVLNAGRGMVGGLHAAMGIGGLLILPATVSVIATVGVHRSVTIGLALWGTPLVVCAAIVSPSTALVMFAIIGVGDAVVDVGFYGVLQEAVPRPVLAPTLGVVEAMFQAGLALGSVIGAQLLEAFDPRTVLLLVGLPLPLLAAATSTRLHSFRAHRNRPSRQYEPHQMLRSALTER